MPVVSRLSRPTTGSLLTEDFPAESSRNERSVDDQGFHRDLRRQLVFPAEIRELHDKGKAAKGAPHAVHQLRAGAGCAAGGQQVIHDQDAGVPLKAVRQDFQSVRPVLQAVVDPDHLSGELAGFADRAETDLAGGGQSGPDDETAGFNPHDQIWLELIADQPQLPHHFLPGAGLAHQGGDVAKQDPWLGEIGNFPHQLAQIEGGHGRRISAIAGSIAAMADAPAPLQTPLSRRGIERLDLMLLCAEALDLNGGEAMVWLSEEMGFRDLFPNRVELWKRRCSNPLRRNTRRAALKPEETDALIRILNALAERLYPMLRTLLSSAEPPELNQQRWDLFRSRLKELVQERLNPRRGGVQRLLDPQEGAELSRELVQAMALSAGKGGFERLRASLLDAAV